MSKKEKPFDTIQGAWFEWLEMFVPPSASVEQVTFIKNTFYAGASALMAILNDMHKEKTPPEKFKKKYYELSKEVCEFFNVLFENT